ncbi:hypothetical protein ACPUEK_05805 [Marinomonas gallaica]|uniref:hypothetical protein n=1 Tax=Marinomonas gallaica TaxID=1806667 RepID=UPI003CE4B1BC
MPRQTIPVSSSERVPLSMVNSRRTYGRLWVIRGRISRMACRLNISTENWLTIANGFEAHTYSAVGGEEVLTVYCQKHQRKRRTGIGCYRKMFAA